MKGGFRSPDMSDWKQEHTHAQPTGLTTKSMNQE